jgi:hypothetical protein
MNLLLLLSLLICESCPTRRPVQLLLLVPPMQKELDKLKTLQQKKKKKTVRRSSILTPFFLSLSLCLSRNLH